MNTFLLDDFHLNGKFQKTHHLNIVKKNKFDEELPKMSSKKSLWVTKELPKAFLTQDIYKEQTQLQRFATLIIVGTIPEAEKQKLATAFKTLIIAPEDVSLPVNEMIEVFKSKNAERYIITGEVDFKNESMILVRGNFEKLLVPFSTFQISGDRTKPDFKKFTVTDHGQTIALGDYEASVESLLYEFDPEFRKHLKKERSKKDKSFGACLRRLRLQKGLKQTDFPEIDEKEIGRIERGEVTKPHQTTLEKIASTLGVDVEEILNY